MLGGAFFLLVHIINAYRLVMYVLFNGTVDTHWSLRRYCMNWALCACYEIHRMRLEVPNWFILLKINKKIIV